PSLRSHKTRSINLIVLRQPSSTPFPYTTLFRSGFADADKPLVGVDLHHGTVGFHRAIAAGEPLSFRFVHARKAEGFDLGNLHRADRKSTRLNSSHVKISYAVFCLKKKTKTQALQ